MLEDDLQRGRIAGPHEVKVARGNLESGHVALAPGPEGDVRARSANSRTRLPRCPGRPPSRRARSGARHGACRDAADKVRPPIRVDGRGIRVSSIGRSKLFPLKLTSAPARASSPATDASSNPLSCSLHHRRSSSATLGSAREQEDAPIAPGRRSACASPALENSIPIRCRSPNRTSMQQLHQLDVAHRAITRTVKKQLQHTQPTRPATTTKPRRGDYLHPDDEADRSRPAADARTTRV